MSPATAGARMGKSAEEGRQLMDNFFSQFPNVQKLMEASKATLESTGYVEDWAGRRRRLPDFKLPAYEIKPLASKTAETSIFNPFLCCKNKENTLDPEVLSYWEARKQDLIDDSNDWQRRKNPKHKDKGEMSNAAYELFARGALSGNFMRRRYGSEQIIEAKGPKYAVQILANTGRRAQAERQCLNARIQGGAASLTKLAMVNVHNDQELKDLQAQLVITVHDEVLVECPMAYANQVEKRLPKVMIDTAAPFINVPMACDPYAERQWYIGEYSVAIQSEFKKLEEKGLDKEAALAAIIANHPEMPAEALTYTIETGEEIDTDLFPIESVEEHLTEVIEPSEDANIVLDEDIFEASRDDSLRSMMEALEEDFMAVFEDFEEV